MPRISRQLSSSGMYHVMWRGVNKQDVFLNDEDHEYFIHLLSLYRYADRYEVRASASRQRLNNYSVLCYCIMTNHIHILIQEGDEYIGDSMKRIGISFAAYYNRKYSRTGNVFEGRFRSEPVNDTKYMLQLLRYIHRNPVKAGMVTEVPLYPWSSWAEFDKRGQTPPVKFKPFCNIGAITDNYSMEEVQQFVLEDNNDEFVPKMEEIKMRLTSDDCQALLASGGFRTPTDFLSAERSQQEAWIRIYKDNGMSYSQIEEYTGWTVSKIRTLMRKK